MSSRFSSQDLERLGLSLNPDGSYSRKKIESTIQEPASKKVVKKKAKKKSTIVDTVFQDMNRVGIDKYAQSIGGIYIPGEVHSKKNKKKIIHIYKRQPDGTRVRKPIIGNSDIVNDYIKENAEIFDLKAKHFQSLIQGWKFPIKLNLFFIRSSNRPFDYNNISQLITDMMQDHKWIENDNCNFIIPEFTPYGINRLNPGVIIRPIKIL